MNDTKYIGLDVHQATISAAVLDSTSKLVMESILETKAATILQFIHGLRGSLHVTFEEGTCAAWLHVTGELFLLTSPFIALATPAGWLYGPETPAERSVTV
ncbi:MAG: hypothetical protein WAR24_02165, partial [Candidatus Acidiferrales bacterium]